MRCAAILVVLAFACGPSLPPPRPPQQPIEGTIPILLSNGTSVPIWTLEITRPGDRGVPINRLAQPLNPFGMIEVAKVQPGRYVVCANTGEATGSCRQTTWTAHFTALAIDVTGPTFISVHSAKSMGTAKPRAGYTLVEAKSFAGTEADEGRWPPRSFGASYSNDSSPSSQPAGCQAKSCSDLGDECGHASDGCGGTLDCGTCPSDDVCKQMSPGDGLKCWNR